jgi:hypothetical protein
MISRFLAICSGPRSCSAAPGWCSTDRRWRGMLTLEVMVTVDGWFSPNGQLWINLVPSTATLRSQMLIPLSLKNPPLFIKRVRSFQNNEEGTGTNITLCNAMGLNLPSDIAPPVIAPVGARGIGHA